MNPSSGRIEPLLTEVQIHTRIRELGVQIARDYAGTVPVVLGLLNGSFIFMADLVRAMDLDLEVTFMRVASYGGKTVTTGEVKILHDLDCTIQGRDVLIVEDIVDTGLTLHKVRNVLMDRQPARIRIATLLDKPSRRRVEVPVDYVGFTIEDHFVVGLGLDLDGKFRNLPFVGVYRPEGE
jgi:hypoxanthine phosphoribosyltransferase